MTILLFCEVSQPEQIWELNWKDFLEDILFRQRRILRFDQLQLSENQLRNYALYEIEKLLIKAGKSLKDYPPMPLPDMSLIRERNNRLLEEELSCMAMVELAKLLCIKQ